MVKHTQTIRRHFVRLALKGLRQNIALKNLKLITFFLKKQTIKCLFWFNLYFQQKEPQSCQFFIKSQSIDRRKKESRSFLSLLSMIYKTTEYLQMKCMWEGVTSLEIHMFTATFKTQSILLFGRVMGGHIVCSS